MADDFFERVLSGGVGIGTGVYAFRKGIGQSIAGPVASEPKNLLIGKLRGLEANQSISNSFQKARLQTGIEFLDPLLDKTVTRMGPNNIPEEITIPGRLSKAGLDSSILKQEWAKVVQSTVPEASSFSGQFPMKDDPVGNIRLNLQKNRSIYTFDVFEKFRYNMEALMQSKGGYDFTSAADFKQFGLLKSEMTPLSSHLKPLVEAMGGPGQFRFTRMGEPGEGTWTAFRRQGESLEKLFSIPEAFAAPGSNMRGLVRTGDNLQNIYAPGLFQMVGENGAPVGNMLTFDQFKIQRLTETAEAVRAGDISGSLENALRATSREVDKMMPFMEPNIGGAAFSPETIYKSKQFSAIDEATGQLLTKIDKIKFVQEHSDKMGFLPSGGEARFTQGQASEVFGGFTDELDYARKPGQRIRQFSATDDAVSAIRGSRYGGAEFDFLDSPMLSKSQGNMPTAARLKTLYLDESQIENLRALGFPVGDGELLVNQKMREQLQGSRLKRLRITEANSDLAGRVMGQLGGGNGRGVMGEAINLNRNELIGRTIEGALEASRGGERIVGASPVTVSTMGGKTATALDLLIQETIDATDSSKLFGTVKGQGRFLDFDSLLTDDVLKVLGVTQKGELQNLGAIARASDVGIAKDPSKYLMQQFSGVMAFAQDESYYRNKTGTTGPITEVANKFLSGSSQYMDEINQLEGVGAKSAAIQKMARELGIEGNRFDMIFGSKGPRIGLAAVALGDPKELTGAGKVGTFEPRLLTLMEGGAFGQHGDDIGSDLLARLYHGRPEVKAMSGELRKTIRSITGDMSPGAGAAIYDLTDLEGSVTNKLHAQGGFIQTGLPDMPHIYMPGYEQAPAMRPRLFGGDQKIQGSPVAHIFKDIGRDLRSVAEGKMTTEEIMGRFDADKTGYRSQLWRAYAPGGKGQGAVARGKLLGSRFLTAVSDIGPTKESSGFSEAIKRAGNIPKGRIIGISGSHAEQMFQEIETIYGLNSAKGMRSRFESGEAIGGMVARHPFIGPYSAQPVMMVKARTSDPVMLVPETTRTVKVAGTERKVMEGILHGLALDKDADIPMAVALNPNMEKKVRTGLQTAGSQLQQDLASYEEHSLRSQLLKMEARPSRQMSTAERAAASVGKLGIADEEVGRVSTALTKARAALVNSSMSSTDVNRGLSLLEWMEQQPISGKHLNPSQVIEGVFQQQMTSIREGAKGNPDMLKDVLSEMLQHSDKTQQQINTSLLGKGIQVDGQFVKGFEIDKTSHQIQSAMQQFMSRSRKEQQDLIHGLLTPGATTSLKKEHAARALAATSMSPEGGIRKFQQTTLSKLNEKLGGAVAKARPFAKPAMIGLAAAGAAAFMLSGSPGEELEPPRHGRMDTNPPVRNTNQSRDEVQMPSSQQLGDPSGPGMMANSARLLDEAGAERGKSIRAKINAGNITPQQRAALSSRLAANYNGSLNMNVRDSRRSLNNTTITDILDS